MLRAYQFVIEIGAAKEERFWIGGTASQDRRNDFDAAAEKYRECRSALEPALLRLLRSENTGEPVNQSASSDLIAAINRLLAFADRP